MGRWDSDVIMMPLWPRRDCNLAKLGIFLVTNGSFAKIIRDDNGDRHCCCCWCCGNGGGAQPSLASLSRLSPVDFRKAVEKLVEARTETSSRRSDRVWSLHEFIFARTSNTIARPRRSGKKGNWAIRAFLSLARFELAALFLRSSGRLEDTWARVASIARFNEGSAEIRSGLADRRGRSNSGCCDNADNCALI